MELKQLICHIRLNVLCCSHGVVNTKLVELLTLTPRLCSRIFLKIEEEIHNAIALTKKLKRSVVVFLYFPLGLLNPRLSFHRTWFNRCYVERKKKFCDHTNSRRYKIVALNRLPY